MLTNRAVYEVLASAALGAKFRAKRKETFGNRVRIRIGRFLVLLSEYVVSFSIWGVVIKVYLRRCTYGRFDGA